MNWEAISAIAETIGGIAIVFTLIYLAIQTRQNSQMIRAQMIQESSDALREIYLPFTNPEFSASVIQACYRPENEEPDQTNELATVGWLLAATKAFETQYLLHRQRVFDEEIWNAWSHSVLGAFRTDFAMKWWGTEGRTYVTPEFADFFDGLITQAEGHLGFSPNVAIQPGDANFSDYEYPRKDDKDDA